MKKFGKVMMWLGLGLMLFGLCGLLFNSKNVHVYYALVWGGFSMNILGALLRDLGKEKEFVAKRSKEDRDAL